MLDCFLDYDTDKSGALDRNEMMEVVEDLDLKLPPKKLLKLINKLDEDGSGSPSVAAHVARWVVDPLSLCGGGGGYKIPPLRSHRRD